MQLSIRFYFFRQESVCRYASECKFYTFLFQYIGNHNRPILVLHESHWQSLQKKKRTATIEIRTTNDNAYMIYQCGAQAHGTRLTRSIKSTVG